VCCQQAPKIYTHGGDLGDTILFLPNLKYRRGSSLLLSYDRRVRDPYTPEHAEVILPLLRSQDYILEARCWRDGDERLGVVDGNAWRNVYNGFTQLCYAQVDPYGTPLSVCESPWLSVEKKRVARVVLNRSLRYAGNLDYSLLKQDDCVFIGLECEHVAFCSQWWDVPYYPTDNLLVAAEVIAGAELFVGNQSCCYAIAEALKQRLIQDTCVRCPNNIIVRDGAKYSLYDSGEVLKAFINS
jgi:hypothetical protein